MKPLIIVESGTKIKTISKLLNYKYEVICSYGHFNNLPKNELGIDIDKWVGKYQITNEKTIKNIRKYVKNSEVIYLAADPDMEGEAIAFHIWNNIKDLLKNKTYYRIEFNEITKNALTNALDNPRQINKSIIEAQETRRFVDRLVGYKLSPTLWSKFDDNTLSVGRVQTVALKFCYNQYQKLIENNIENFWTISGFFRNKNIYEFKLYHNDELVKGDWDKILRIISLFDFQKKFSTQNFENKSQNNPSPPYTTTSLQQDAYNKLRFTSKKTMSVSQQLYENGLITYMRTDSTNISKEFKNKIIKFIDETYEGYSQFRCHKNKIINAQEAHEAIRITDINKMKCEINDDCNRLYELIWKRTIASQMIAAEYTEICTKLSYENKYNFKYKKSFLTKLGYLIIYDGKLENVEKHVMDIENIKIQKYQCQPNLDSQPSLFNEISLIKELEKNGIGRPSTYASIIDKLLEKKYVEKNQFKGQKLVFKQKTIEQQREYIENIEIDTSIKRKDLLIPTNIGKEIIEFLNEQIPFLLDITFTSNMEMILDKITNNEFSKNKVLSEFFENHIKPYSVEMKKKEIKSGIIKTKYGYCFYNEENNKYTNIESYLKWKKKNVDDLEDKEVNFIKSLPKQLDTNSYLHLGPYGLYKKLNGKNVKIDKNEWESFIT